MRISDRITVLRDGKLVGTVDRKDTNENALAKMMVGRITTSTKRHETRQTGEPVLTVENLELKDERGLHALKGITFEVNEGEILGFAGVSGNGQAELTKILTGVLKPSGGLINLNDCNLTGASPSQITSAGIGRTPEDRHAGVVGELTVAENLALESLEEFVEKGTLNREKIRENALKLIEQYQIKAQPDDKIRTLSGGNMQKVVMARSLSRNPCCVIASQPTRGLDVGATEYVRSMLVEQRDRGAAVLLVSEDLEEIMELSDRIAVIYEGQITGVLSGSEVTEEKLGLMMSGAIR
jgi:simple sugar transport system ATP-binding protein